MKGLRGSFLKSSSVHIILIFAFDYGRILLEVGYFNPFYVKKSIAIKMYFQLYVSKCHSFAQQRFTSIYDLPDVVIDTGNRTVSNASKMNNPTVQSTFYPTYKFNMNLSTLPNSELHLSCVGY